MSGVESENDYQTAFAAFMLQNAHNTLNERSAANVKNAIPTPKTTQSPDGAPSDRKWARLYYETMMRDWIPVRDNLVQVFDSLAQLHRQYLARTFTGGSPSIVETIARIARFFAAIVATADRSL
jgi:hypothetical protein